MHLITLQFYSAHLEEQSSYSTELSPVSTSLSSDKLSLLESEFLYKIFIQYILYIYIFYTHTHTHTCLLPSLHQSIFLLSTAKWIVQTRQCKSPAHTRFVFTESKRQDISRVKMKKAWCLSSQCCKQFSDKIRNPSSTQSILQYLWQLTQISIMDVPTNAMIRVFYVGSHKMKSICCCQKWKQFVLLGLIIQNLGFWCPGAKDWWVSMPATGKLLITPIQLHFNRRSCIYLTSEYPRLCNKSLWQGKGRVKYRRLLTLQCKTVWKLSNAKANNVNISPFPLRYSGIFCQHSSCSFISLHLPRL